MGMPSLLHRWGNLILGQRAQLNKNSEPCLYDCKGESPFILATACTAWSCRLPAEHPAAKPSLDLQGLADLHGQSWCSMGKVMIFLQAILGALSCWGRTCALWNPATQPESLIPSLNRYRISGLQALLFTRESSRLPCWVVTLSFWWLWMPVCAACWLLSSTAITLMPLRSILECPLYSLLIGLPKGFLTVLCTGAHWLGSCLKKADATSPFLQPRVFSFL